MSPDKAPLDPRSDVRIDSRLLANRAAGDNFTEADCSELVIAVSLATCFVRDSR